MSSPGGVIIGDDMDIQYGTDPSWLSVDAAGQRFAHALGNGFDGLRARLGNTLDAEPSFTSITGQELRHTPLDFNAPAGMASAIVEKVKDTARGFDWRGLALKTAGTAVEAGIASAIGGINPPVLPVIARALTQ